MPHPSTRTLPGTAGPGLAHRSRGLLLFALSVTSAAHAAEVPTTSRAAATAQTDASLPDAPGYTNVETHAAQQDAAAAPLTVRGTPLRILKDEAAIFTSPARLHTRDLKWLLPLAGATGAALATDTYTMRNVVSRSAAFNDASNSSSDVLLGTAIGVPVLLFGIGHARANEHQREAGLLAGEAIVDAYAFDTVVKYTTLRERPNRNDARGHFFVGGASSSPSFVSGHCIMAWSSAAVLAEEYHRPWQQVGIYTLAGGVSLTRVLAQQHFPTDALLGSAAGWLIGHYVYRKHHREAGLGSTISRTH